MTRMTRPGFNAGLCPEKALLDPIKIAISLAKRSYGEAPIATSMAASQTYYIITYCFTLEWPPKD